MIRHWLTVILLTLTGTAFGQDECRERRFEHVRGYPVEIELDGGLAWIADGAGLTVVDVSRPEAPQLISSVFETEAPSLAVEPIGGDRVAVLTSRSLRLHRLVGTELQPAGGVELSAVNLHRTGDALVAVGSSLRLFSVAGDQPVETASVPLPGTPSDSFLVDDMVLVVIDGLGTYIFDTDLTQYGRIRSTASSIVGADGIAFLGREAEGIFAIDISDPDNPLVLDQLDVFAHTLALEADRLLASDADGTVRVIDVSDPADLAATGTAEVDLDVMTLHDGLLYGYGWGRDRFGVRFENGPYLRILDASTNSFDSVGELERSTGPLTGVATDGETAWIADPPFVRAVDLSTGGLRWSLELEQPFTRVRFERDLLLLYGATWLHVVDPYGTQGSLLGSWPTQGVPGGGATFSGPWLIEANRASGFHVLDFSDPSNIHQRGGIINDGRGQWNDVVGIAGAVYGRVNTGVKVVALGEDPAAVATVGFLPIGATNDLEVISIDGVEHLAILGSAELYLYELSSPLAPQLVSITPVKAGQQIAVADETIWILTHDQTALGVDVSDPHAPRILEEITGMRAGEALSAARDVVVGADRWALFATALTAVEELSPPELVSSESENGTVELRWAPRPVRSTEIEIAPEVTFETPIETRIVGGGTTSIATNDRELWVRARYRNACGAGAWSQPVRIEATRTIPSRTRPVRRPGP